MTGTPLSRADLDFLLCDWLEVAGSTTRAED